MGDEKIRILLIEDNPGDARLIRELLTAAEGASFDLEHAERLSTGLARLARGDIDVILLDLSLPDSQGLDGLNKICEQTPKVPVVVLSGLSDEAVAVNAVQEGAQDYLVKGSVDSDSLVRSLHYAIERQHLRVALRESESRYRLLADNAADLIWTANMKWQISYVSPSIKRLLGYTVEEMKRLAIKDILTTDSLRQAGKLIRNQMDIMTPGSQYPPMSLVLEHVRKDGSTLWAEVMLSFLWDKDGRLSEVLGVTRDTTERKKAEEALRQSEQRYRLIAENVNDIIWTRDMNLRTTYVSPSVTQMSGYSVEEVMSLSIEESVTPHSLEVIRSAFSKVMAEAKEQRDLSEAVVLEVELLHKNGSITPVEMKVNLLHDSDGRLTGFLGVTRDITGRKKAEEALRASEEELKAIFDSSMNGIALLDLEGRLIRVNKRVLEVGGYDMEEISGKPLGLLKMFTPASIERMAFARDIILSGKEATAFECEVCTKSGTKMSLEVNVGPFLLKGQLFGLVAVMRDITERKRAEEALRESEERFRAVFEGTSLGIALVDFDGKALSINPAFERMLGYNMEEFKEIEETLKYLHPDDAMMDAKLYIEMLKGKREHYTVDKRYIRKDAGIIWGRQNLSVVRDAEGKPKYFVAMVEDITERKKMEQALKESEERLRRYWDSSPDAIYIHDLQGTFLRGNKAGEELLGYSADEIEGRSFLELPILPPEYFQKAIQSLQLSAAGKPTGPDELELVRKDGSRIFVEISTYPTTHDDKVEVIGIARDITQRKRMEDALRESEERHRLCFENASDVIYSVDPEGTILSMSPAVERLLGYKPEELIGRNMAELNVVPPEKLEQALIDTMRALAGERIISSDSEFFAKDGSVKFGEISGAPIFSRDGKVIAAIFVARDITERKKMEEELLRLSDAVRMTTESVVIVDLKGKIIDVNEAAVRTYGAEVKAELIGTGGADSIVPEDRERALKDLAEVTKKGYVKNIEYRVLRKDGTKIDLETSASVMRVKNGEPTGLVAVTRDITEQKRAKDALRDSEERLRRLVDNAPDIIFRWSVEKGLEYVSPVVSAITGYSVEELMADPKLGLELARGENFKLAQNYERVVKQGISGRIRELTFVRKDGKQAYLDIKTQAIRNDEGKIVAFEGILRDITERKRMEEALKRSEQNYRVLFNSILDGLVVLDAETMKVVLANETAARMAGFDSPQSIMGMNPLSYLPPEEKERAYKLIAEEVFEKDLHNNHEYRALNKDGKELWVSVVSTKTEYQGKMAALVSIMDITERKRLEDERHRLEEQLLLAGRLAAVGELAAGVAHELNNPIAAIKGFAQFLTARKDLDETIRKDLDTIYRESQRAAKITQNLLSFARRHEPEKHPISINDVIENILEMQDHRMKVNNIELEVELDPDLPKTMADFHQMQQVFLNIVNNAEQAMIEAHGKGRLLIKTQRSGKMVQITFADNGPGISEQNLKRIFDPFFTTKEVGKGTGLGLSICYGLVEAHGGRIYARSKLGQGATLVVEMPIVSKNQLVAEAALLNPGSRGVKWNKPGE